MYGMRNAIENKGQFVISLDFELLWGVWDVTTKEKYGANILGVKHAIPKLLELFEKYDIKATFATVGFLFCKDKDEILTFLPKILPTYSNKSYNVYQKELKEIGTNENDDPYHFGYSLLESLKNSKHEIGTHSFSHYYCLEEGQTKEQFDSDILAATNIAEKNGISLSSFVFPRNQLNSDYLDVLRNYNITVYRGNPNSWIYQPRRFSKEGSIIRICRLLDTYIPLSGYNTHKIQYSKNIPVNIPASRFLKAYSPSLKWLEPLRMQRIKKEMLIAAKKNQLYHLWWHPHNFGINLTENLNFLTNLLEYYSKLNKEYGFTNLTMKEAAISIQNSR